MAPLLLLALLAGCWALRGVARWVAVEWADPWFFHCYGLGAPGIWRTVHFMHKLAHLVVLNAGPLRRMPAFRRALPCLAYLSPMPNLTWATLCWLLDQNFDDLDALIEAPTVRRGAQALGMKRLSQWYYRPRTLSLRSGAHGDTHPLMRPICFFPGLRCTPFYDVESAKRHRVLSWIERLEAASPQIKREFLQVTEQRPKAMGEFLSPEDMSTQVDGWRTFFFVSPLSKQMVENQELCPVTWQLLNSIPGFIPTNMTMFSLLAPGSRIQSHVGLSNAALRVHLPILCPEPAKSVLRAGDQVRTWEEGKVLLFNDAFDHQVWNFGELTRVVLFFDVWHPDLTEEDLEVFRRCWPKLRASAGQAADEHERRARVKQSEDKQSTDDWLKM